MQIDFLINYKHELEADADCQQLWNTAIRKYLLVVPIIKDFDFTGEIVTLEALAAKDSDMQVNFDFVAPLLHKKIRALFDAAELISNSKFICTMDSMLSITLPITTWVKLFRYANLFNKLLMN